MAQPERSSPEIRVRVAGSDLPPEAMTDIKSLSVQQDVANPSSFTFELVNWNQEQMKMKWSDGDQFAAGKPVEVLMGYRDAAESVIAGEITGMQLRISGRDTPALVVRGFDRRHRLMRGQKTRTFLQVKDSEIAQQIAGDAGLSAEATDTAVKLDYVIQHNQTDLEFLLERARRIGYEVLVEDRKLRFRPRPIDETEKLTLDRTADLIEFTARLTTMNQAADCAVQAWDMKAKKPIRSRAAAGAERARMAGSNSGPSTAKGAFGASSIAMVDRPLATQAEVDQMAKARLNEMALSFITGEGITVGNNKLRAGEVVKLAGLGTRFSGLYYVMTTHHTYSPNRGYRTAFAARRNAQ